LLLADEAHATGSAGCGWARVVVERAAALPQRVIALGTLSKALGAAGRFHLPSSRIVQTVLNGRAHMFSTALAPASAAAALAALS